MVEIDESMWKEKTEHYHELKSLESQYKEVIQQTAKYKGSSDSDFVHKDDIEWLLVKERGEAMVFMFFIAPFFWGMLAILLYVFLT